MWVDTVWSISHSFSIFLSWPSILISVLLLCFSGLEWRTAIGGKGVSPVWLVVLKLGIKSAVGPSLQQVPRCWLSPMGIFSYPPHSPSRLFPHPGNVLTGRLLTFPRSCFSSGLPTKPLSSGGSWLFQEVLLVRSFQDGATWALENLSPYPSSSESADCSHWRHSLSNLCLQGSSSQPLTSRLF